MTTQIESGEPVESDGIFIKSIHRDGITKKGDPNSYEDRLRTYWRGPLTWRPMHPRPEDLARAGFIYTGQGTQVHCLTCGIYVEDWNDSRIDPVRKHYMSNRNCPFLLQNCAQKVHDIYISSRYSDASLRLSSFKNWPRSTPVQPSDLAGVGFYYTGEGTKVRCFSCGVVHSNWERGDIPLIIHEQLNPSCEFLADLLIDKNRTSYTEPCVPDAGMPSPDYGSVETRLKSFKHLRSDIVTKEELAEAGLYLVEPPDVVRCYTCSVELRDWAPGETAMGKHAKRSPHCPFVRQQQLVGPVSRCSIVVDASHLSTPNAEHQKMKSVYSGSLFVAAEPPRRHSDNGAYMESAPFKPLLPPSYARSNSVPMHTVDSVTPMLLGSNAIVYGKDVKTNSSTSARWMLDVGVDIRLPPSLDVKRRPASVYSTESSNPMPRSMMTPGSPLEDTSYPTVPPPAALHFPVSAHNPSALPSAPLMPGHVRSDDCSTSDDDSKLCQICFEKPLEMVFIPCGHVYACESCAHKISSCPLCRMSIDKSFRVFLP